MKKGARRAHCVATTAVKAAITVTPCSSVAAMMRYITNRTVLMVVDGRQTLPHVIEADQTGQDRRLDRADQLCTLSPLRR